MKRQADTHRRESELAVGQKVWLSTAHLPLKQGTRKLAEKWTGPFPIIAQVTREAWRLQLPATFRLHPVFHTSQLKPCIGEARHRAPIQLEDATEEYEVERLLDRRIARGQEQFLVRWRGYTAFDDTWEPRANLANAKELLAEFERSHKKQ
jgi:hypothetical protein